MKPQFRIMTNGEVFRIQAKIGPFWRWHRRPWIRGEMTVVGYVTKEEAEKTMALLVESHARRQRTRKWRPV